MSVKISTQKSDPELERIFGVAFRMAWGVARRQWREAAVVALLPAAAASLVWGLPDGAAAPGLMAPVWLGAVAAALSWNLRACLAVLHPAAQGARVALKHFLWRIAVACAFTLAPAVWIFVMVNSGLDPASGWIILAILAAIGLFVIMFALAAVTAARVAATGRFSPLEA